MNDIPSPHDKNPVPLPGGGYWPHTYFLKNIIDHPNIQIGDYTYYNDFRKSIDDFRQSLVPYMHTEAPEKLIIGKFVQIAHGVEFITASASHQFDGFSSYPFDAFGRQWSEVYEPEWPNKGDTIVGHDVWLGHRATVLPALTIGSGAIIGANSVVTRDVPPYTIVGGNPAKIIRPRFDQDTIAALLEIAWWDWPIEKITRAIPHIVKADLSALQKCA